MSGIGTVRVIKTERLTFELRPRLTIVRTNLQAFYLNPTQSYWKRREKFIRFLIENGKVEDFNQLIGFCGPGVKLEATFMRMSDEYEVIEFPTVKTLQK